MRLRQKRVQLEARQIRSRLQSRSPNSHSHATSPPVLDSRNRSPKGGRVPGAGGANLGTGFRWRGVPSVAKAGKDVEVSQSRYSAESSPNGTGNQVSTLMSLSSEMGAALSMKDSDAVSTTSSMPTSASVHNQGAAHNVEAVGVARQVDPLANSLQSSVGSQKLPSQPVLPGGRPAMTDTGVRRKSPSAAPAGVRGLTGSLHYSSNMNTRAAPVVGARSGQVTPVPKAQGARSAQLSRIPQIVQAANIPAPVVGAMRSASTVVTSSAGGMPVSAAVRRSKESFRS